ncbi:MAG: glycine cleavage system protein GcvH [Neisseriaceae bacterium]|nr:MAG: glycine cleavage system protein GcvH [Neisseriaceae bacterium]
MSLVLNHLKYVESHEWVRREDDGTVTIGITDHAQDLLGDVVFVELPEIGTELVKDDQAGVVESVKAASDIYAPISGKVVAINENLEASPDLVNTSPYEEGWFFVLEPTNPSQIDQLLDAEAYEQEIA